MNFKKEIEKKIGKKEWLISCGLTSQITRPEIAKNLYDCYGVLPLCLYQILPKEKEADFHWDYRGNEYCLASIVSLTYAMEDFLKEEKLPKDPSGERIAIYYLKELNEKHIPTTFREQNGIEEAVRELLDKNYQRLFFKKTIRVKSKEEAPTRKIAFMTVKDQILDISGGVYSIQKRLADFFRDHLLSMEKAKKEEAQLGKVQEEKPKETGIGKEDSKDIKAMETSVEEFLLSQLEDKETREIMMLIKASCNPWTNWEEVIREKHGKQKEEEFSLSQKEFLVDLLELSSMNPYLPPKRKEQAQEWKTFVEKRIEEGDEVVHFSLKKQEDWQEDKSLHALGEEANLEKEKPRTLVKRR